MSTLADSLRNSMAMGQGTGGISGFGTSWESTEENLGRAPVDMLSQLQTFLSLVGNLSKLSKVILPGLHMENKREASQSELWRTTVPLAPPPVDMQPFGGLSEAITTAEMSMLATIDNISKNIGAEKIGAIGIMLLKIYTCLEEIKQEIKNQGSSLVAIRDNIVAGLVTIAIASLIGKKILSGGSILAPTGMKGRVGGLLGKIGKGAIISLLLTSLLGSSNAHASDGANDSGGTEGFFGNFGETALNIAMFGSLLGRSVLPGLMGLGRVLLFNPLGLAVGTLGGIIYKLCTSFEDFDDFVQWATNPDAVHDSMRKNLPGGESIVAGGNILFESMTMGGMAVTAHNRLGPADAPATITNNNETNANITVNATSNDPRGIAMETAAEIERIVAMANKGVNQ